jgi:hypothetical protein
MPGDETLCPGGIALPRTVTVPLESGMLLSASVFSPYAADGSPYGCGAPSIGASGAVFELGSPFDGAAASPYSSNSTSSSTDCASFATSDTPSLAASTASLHVSGKFCASSGPSKRSSVPPARAPSTR